MFSLSEYKRLKRLFELISGWYLGCLMVPSLVTFLSNSCSLCCINWLLFRIVCKCSLFCTPAPLASSCTSMQCRNSNLVLGNFSAQPSSAGCSVSSCSYSGFVNGTIMTTWVDRLHPLLLFVICFGRLIFFVSVSVDYQYHFSLGAQVKFVNVVAFRRL